MRSTRIARKGAIPLPGLSCPLCRPVLRPPPIVPAKGGSAGFGGWVPVGHMPGERRCRSARSGPVVSVGLPKGVYVCLRASWVISRSAVEVRPRPRTAGPVSRVSRRRHPGSVARRVHPTREHQAVPNAHDPLALAAHPRISQGLESLAMGNASGVGRASPARRGACPVSVVSSWATGSIARRHSVFRKAPVTARQAVTVQIGLDR